MTAPSSELIVNALPLPVLTVGRGGAILQANAAAEAFFDLSLRVLQRQPLKDLLPFGSPSSASSRRSASAVRASASTASTSAGPASGLSASSTCSRRR